MNRKGIRSIVLGFVIFNPEKSFFSRLQAASRLGYKVFIFDNSPNLSFMHHFQGENSNIRYMTSGRNKGLGFGMSLVCAQAYYENNSALLFFDQDSIFNEETLDFIENFYDSNGHLQATHSAVAFRQHKPNSDISGSRFNNVMLAINSGSLFFLNSLKKIGWHSDSYFVDCVDYEFCFRSHRKGLLIGEYSSTPGFDHSSEQADEIYTVFNKKLVMRAYPLFRIIDTVSASSKLVLITLFTGNFKFCAKILRLFSIYIGYQLLSRTLRILTKTKSDERKNEE